MDCSRPGSLPNTALAILLVSSLFGCAGYGLPSSGDPLETHETVQGRAFRHLVLTRRLHDAGSNETQPVFVFLEHDGLPWQTPTVVSNDPTPRRPLALGLFRSTDQPAIYLGRPCQWVGTFEPPCHPYYWTNGRFDPEVVDSLIAALDKAIPGNRRPLIFVGHSGGGTLAVLMAHRSGRAAAVVTFAAVLDHRSWTGRLGLTALSGSLNPADQTRRSGPVAAELHVFGAQDDVVKPDDAAEYLKSFHAETLVLPQADHHCCWQSWWTAEGIERAKRLARLGSGSTTP